MDEFKIPNLEENEKLLAEPFVTNFIMTIYKSGFEDGMRDCLLKILENLDYVGEDASEKLGMCIQYELGWEDNGCCCNCVQCVKQHFKNDNKD